MKKMIQHWTTVLLAGVVALSASCSTDEDTPQPSPVFPEPAVLNIPAGETVCEVSFTPNLDWTVSIPTDAETAKWFKLRDGEITTTSITGKASTSPVTIKVETTTQESFDLAPVCEVSLTMGGETQVIATITRMTTAREFELYASSYNTEDDDFIIPYEYSETPLTKYADATENPTDVPEGTVELKWPIRVGGFMYVFKSVSNFEWLASTPSWLNVTSTLIDEATGTYQIMVNAEFTEENINGATGVIDFYDANLADKTEDPGNNAHNKYYVTIPAATGIVRHPYANINATFNFNADGQYVSQSLGGDETVSDNLTTTVSSTKGLKFFALKPDGFGGYYAAKEETAWMTIADTWDNAAGVFQQHTYTVTVTANTGNARSAALLAIPEALAKDIDENGDLDSQLLDTDGSFDVKAEYKPYLFATVEQEGANSGSEGGFSITSGSENSYYEQNGYFKFEDLTNVDPETDEDVAANAGEIEMGAKLYRLTYNNSSMSEGSIFLDIAGDYIMTMTMPYGNEWLIFYDAASGMVDNGKCMIGMSGEDLSQGQKGDKGSIVFYGPGSSIVGHIICVRNY